MNFASDNTAGMAPRNPRGARHAPIPATRSATAMTTGPGGSSSASPRSSSARSRCSWCRPARWRMRSRSRISRRPGARCCAMPSRMSRPTNAARRNSSAAASSWSGCRARGARFAPATLRAALDGQWGGPHHVSPARAVAVAGDRMRHDLSRRRGQGTGRDRACARRRGAHGRRALGNALARMNVSPAEADLEGRRRCALVRRHQGRRDGRGGRDLLRPQARRQHAGPAQARRRARLEASLHRGADGGVSRRTISGSSSRATPTRWRTRSPRG